MINNKYSVLMSIYYKENPDFFRESINSMLNQTLKPDEIVIVKDGTLTRELENVIKEFDKESIIKIVHLKKTKGLGEALNIGMEHCSNEFIARMDTDDISRNDRCEKQLSLFMEKRSLSIVSSSIAEFEEAVEEIKTIKNMVANHKDIVNYAKRRNPFNHPAVMYKKSAVEKAGGYKHFQFFEDYYLWVRMIMSGAVCANINEPLLYMRANSDLYNRRGGFTYFKCAFRFKRHIKEIGFISNKDFLISTVAQGIVAIVPNKVRMIIYKKLLR
jgi:cellulose synthase/poly-beta-1,6-N-acetylglucosamine synthase-like glycosyltransferase